MGAPASAAGAATGAVVALDQVTRRFGEVTAVDALSLALHPGEFVTLLGPSGCGKTTALRLLAGFEQPDGGEIRFRGETITRWSPQRRGFGMVFQNYALFPHLDVFENVAFGLRSRKHPAAEIPARVDSALARVDLAGYARRAVQALSGGQQQRVALARALAIEPPLLLLDEPLSNLDQALRVRTRTELRALVRELGITALFVTHDQEEAFDLSDRIAVMSAGRLRQFDAPRVLYETPADRFVAGFVGRINEFPVVVEGDALRLPGGVEWGRPAGGSAGEGRPPAKAAGRGPALLLLRPEQIGLASGDTPGALRGILEDRRFGGAVTTWRVRVDGVEEVVEVVLPAGSNDPEVAPGEVVGLLPRSPGAGILFDG